MSSDSFCLIGGSGRSGSTVLGRIFAGHPDLTDLPESRFLIDPDGLVEFYASLGQTWSPYIMDLRIRRLEALLRVCGRKKTALKPLVRLLKRLGLESASPRRLRPGYLGTEMGKIIPEYDQMVDELIAQLTTFAYRGAWVGMTAFQDRSIRFCGPEEKEKIRHSIAQFYNGIFMRRRQEVGGVKFFEKNTFSILFFDQIREILSDVRLVHIYRDPRDVVSSYVKQEWSPKNVHDAALWYKGIMAQWKRVKARVPDSSYIEVGLEALVADPKTELQRICDFWEIDWNPVLLDIPLNKANSGRWQQGFSDAEQATMMELLAPELARYGYR